MVLWLRPSVPGGLVMGPRASKPVCKESMGYHEKKGEEKNSTLENFKSWRNAIVKNTQGPTHSSFGFI